MDVVYMLLGLATIGLALAAGVLAVVKLKDRPGGMLFSVKYFAVLPVYALSRVMQPGPEEYSEDAFMDFMATIAMGSTLMAIASGVAGVGLLKLMSARARQG